MYRPDKPAHGLPPFGPPPPRVPHFRHGAPCAVAPSGHLPPRPCGPFSASAPDSHFLYNRPSTGHFIRAKQYLARKREVNRQPTFERKKLPLEVIEKKLKTIKGIKDLKSHWTLQKCVRSIPNGWKREPPCSSFSIDHSSVIGLGVRQQIGPPVEPPHAQVQQWNSTPVKHHSPDNSERAGEEFLRCIAANKPLPDYLKGNMAYNLVDAFKSANVLKEAIKSDPKFQKHVTRSKSRSRSHGRSRGKSQPKSSARSKSRARSRSRGRSKSGVHAKSRARSRSRARSKSRTRSWSRSRSPSRSKKRHVRSKSRARRSKSRSSSREKSHGKGKKRKRSPSHIYSSSDGSSDTLTENSLLEGLKLVMNSRELEEQLPSLKDAILTIQASDESKKVESVSTEQRHEPLDSQFNSTSLENDCMLLPHDRVGGDFAWLQAQNQEDSTVQKAKELEDEESFLYGNVDIGEKQVNKSSASLFPAYSQIEEHANLQEMDSIALSSQQCDLNRSAVSSFGDLFDLKQPNQKTSSSSASASLEGSECEKIKNILKSLSTANISEVMVKMQSQKEKKQLSPALLNSNPTAAGLALPALSDPNVRQALESLQSLIKATKEKRAKTDGSGTSQASSDIHKAGDCEERKREIKVRMSKMGLLMKELEGLLKQDGLNFLTPVIGFYCQKCNEFVGDLNSAENHAAMHSQSNSTSKVQVDKQTGDSKVHSHFSSSNSNQHPHPSDRSDHREYNYHKGSGDHRDYKQGRRDERDHRNKHDDDHKSQRDGEESISLKEEMKKERMLITVSCGVKPLPNVRVKEEINKELQASGTHCKAKVEDSDSKGKTFKDSSDKGKAKDESSDGSGDDKETTKAKSSKKKKKKKKEKKKKAKKEKS